MSFKFIILDYIEGSGKKDGVISSLKKKQGMAIKLDQFLQELNDVKQFDWGDFFLFKEFPESWEDPKGALYPYVVAQTNTTIRAVDNQYIYVYTPYRELVDLIKNTYPTIESIKEDALNNLDFPE
ncbi:hypothetical protein [Candidatus Protochlamydia phocaeensis]|uniref:hypothetical protein n=1 Tax=Candidatus Protochlamydia phocaeensis TaxID=1414722 RepID=UPI000837C4BE|nr:hypothetical protein [Candidatus Protochlamydia phocaeensis]